MVSTSCRICRFTVSSPTPIWASAVAMSADYAGGPRTCVFGHQPAGSVRASATHRVRALGRGPPHLKQPAGVHGRVKVFGIGEVCARAEATSPSSPTSQHQHRPSPQYHHGHPAPPLPVPRGVRRRPPYRARAPRQRPRWRRPPSRRPMMSSTIYDVTDERRSGRLAPPVPADADAPRIAPYLPLCGLAGGTGTRPTTGGRRECGRFRGL